MSKKTPGKTSRCTWCVYGKPIEVTGPFRNDFCTNCCKKPDTHEGKPVLSSQQWRDLLKLPGYGGNHHKKRTPKKSFDIKIVARNKAENAARVANLVPPAIKDTNMPMRMQCRWCASGKPLGVGHFKSRNCQKCAKKPDVIDGQRLLTPEEWNGVRKVAKVKPRVPMRRPLTLVEIR